VICQIHCFEAAEYYDGMILLLFLSFPPCLAANCLFFVKSTNQLVLLDFKAHLKVFISISFQCWTNLILCFQFVLFLYCDLQYRILFWKSFQYCNHIVKIENFKLSFIFEEKLKTCFISIITMINQSLHFQ